MVSNFRFVERADSADRRQFHLNRSESPNSLAPISKPPSYLHFTVVHLDDCYPAPSMSETFAVYVSEFNSGFFMSYLHKSSVCGANHKTALYDFKSDCSAGRNLEIVKENLLLIGWL